MFGLTHIRLLLVPAMAVTLWLGAMSVALAADPVETKLVLKVPAEVELEDHGSLEAQLLDSEGKPVSNATVTFYSPAGFLSGSAGLMRIGEAVTDANGVAVSDYAPRRGGTVDIVAEYLGNEGHQPSRATASMEVLGNHQVYEAEAGIRVPLVNKWLLVAILAAVWGTLFFVVFQIVRIAAEPGEPAKNVPWRR